MNGLICLVCRVLRRNGRAAFCGDPRQCPDRDINGGQEVEEKQNAGETSQDPRG
jgi:hypothetical protein